MKYTLVKKSFFGFTVLEIIIILVIVGILGTVAVPVVNNLVTNARIEITIQNMKEIERAIIGDPSANFVGFRQVMRQNPNPLNQLWNVQATAYNVHTEMGDGTRVFLEGGFIQGNTVLDGWGTAIQWEHDQPAAGQGRLTSAGPDRNMGAAGDNIIRVIGED